MKKYNFIVKVLARDVKDWFWNRSLWYGMMEDRNTVFSASDEMFIIEEKIPYSGIYDGSVNTFSLPAKELIILGLKHIGLLNCPGVQGYHVKSWSKYVCKICVIVEKIKEPIIKKEVDLSKCTPHYVNEYSERERDIQYRIQRFFAPTGIVVTWDKTSLTGFPSD